MFCSPSVSRDFDPPSVAAATRASGSTVAPGKGSFSGSPAGHPSRPPHRPDPEGVDSQSTVMGRMGGIGGMGGMGGRRPSGRSSYGSGFSSFSTDEIVHAYNFPGAIPETIPSVVFYRFPSVDGKTHCALNHGT